MINHIGFGAFVDFVDLGAAGALVDLRIEIGLRFEAEGSELVRIQEGHTSGEK